MRRSWFLISMLAALTGLACTSDAPERADTGVARAAVGASPTDDAAPVRTVDPVVSLATEHLSRGSTLDVALRHLGVDAPTAVEVSRAVDTIHPVRSLRVGVPVTVGRDEGGALAEVLLWTDRRQGVRVSPAGEGWGAVAIERPLDRYVRLLRGEITSSFYDAVVEAGGDAALVLAVTDILQWDVDFFVDPRPGDRFALLVEEWVDGQVPVELGDILAVEYEGERVSATAYAFAGDDRVRYYRADGASVQRTLLKSPLNYRRISSHFSHSRFHPILRRHRPHLGVDYAAATGTPVVTIGDGTVEHVGTKGGYGKTVIVRHNGRITTQYAHLSRYGKGIRSGAKVTQGQVIGYVGSTGLSTGPHLDFRCKVNGSWVNPLTMERLPAEPVADEIRDAFELLTGTYRDAMGSLPGPGYLDGASFEARYGAEEVRSAALGAPDPAG